MKSRLLLVIRYVAFLLLPLLAACAAVTAPPGGRPGRPVIGDTAFTARDGMVLPLRHWGPLSGPRAIIVALHGMSDYSNAFAMPGAVWAQQGILTLAYDQRGFGAAPNPGLWPGAGTMRDDLRDAVAAAHARWPGVPVFALGESMGGAVVLTAMEQPLDVTGAILVAPAVWSRADMPVSYRVALFLAAHLLPGLVLSNNAAHAVVRIVASDNDEMLRALGRDPLFQKKTRADVVFGLTNLMDEARTAPARLAAAASPILFLYGAKDQLIPAAPTRAVRAALGDRAEVRHYDNGYHMLLRDLDRARPQADIAAWVLGATKAAR